LTALDYLQEDHALLLQAVREAGNIARKFFDQGAKSWEKNPGDPVTEADLAVNHYLQQRLCGDRPNYGWLSEETEDDLSRLDRHRVWIIDPIDGTRAFIAGRAEFTICAGLVEDGRPLLGAVFNPITHEFFDAVKDGGSRCNGKALKTPDGASLANARLLASQQALERRQGIGVLPKAQFKIINSIAYRMALVALDRFDATISLAKKSDWDIAAAELIVTEAGGRAVAPDGSAFIYNQVHAKHVGVVAAAPALCQEILDRL
jgi:myo-inositol-1(or 4)-monophosphatase